MFDVHTDTRQSRGVDIYSLLEWAFYWFSGLDHLTHMAPYEVCPNVVSQVGTEKSLSQ